AEANGLSQGALRVVAAVLLHPVGQHQARRVVPRLLLALAQQRQHLGPRPQSSRRHPAPLRQSSGPFPSVGKRGTVRIVLTSPPPLPGAALTDTTSVCQWSRMAGVSVAPPFEPFPKR